MKRILLGIVLIFTGLVAQSQAIRSDVAILDSVAHISSYFGGSKYIQVKDSVLGGAFYLYQGVLPVDGTTIIAGANSSKWKRMYGSYDRRYLSSVGGINNFTVTDSSLLIYLQNNLKLGTKFNQFVLTNTPYVNIPSIYQAKGGSHDGNFNPSQLLLVRKFNEALGDTLVQMGYGGATTAYSEYRMDSGSTRFRYDNKYIVLPNYGFYSDGRFYAPRDSVEVRTNGNGQSGSGAVQAMSIGDTWGYNIYVNSTQYAPYPLAANITTYDFMRNDSRGRKRQITGNGVAGYVADWKNYQYGSVSPSTNEDNSYINKVVDFYSMGGRNDDINAGSTKAKIMLVSKVDSAIGFYSRQKYHPFNEVWNGYGFVQDGTEDYNHFQGRVKIGASRPNRNSGGIAQNLLVEGSTRSDSIFNRYTKFDSTGRIVFTEKNDPSLNGAYLIQLNQTLDSNANQNSVAGGLRSYRNWLDAKNILIPEPTVDARNYYRVGAGRTSTLQNCVGCSFSEYFGYKQIILGAGSTINYSSVEPRIYWARNEVNGLSSGSKGKASGLNLTGYANLFVMGPNVDSVGTLYGYKEDGIIGNSVTDIAAKYSFYDASVWQSNVRTQYGFYQVDNKIKNRFSGLTELGSNIVYLSKDSIPYTGTNGSRQMLTIDTITGIQYRMAIPAGGGGGLSGLTTTRIPFATSSTTIGDADSLTYNTGTKQVSLHNLNILNTSVSRPSLLVSGGGYDYARSVHQPGIAFKGLDTTGFIMRPGNNLGYVSGGQSVVGWYLEGDAAYMQFYGTNRGMISSVSALVFNANNSHYEFEGFGDWRLSIVGYGTASSQGKTIIYESDPTLSVTPLGATGRNGNSAFKIYDSTYHTLSSFDMKGNLRIGDSTYSGNAGIYVGTNMTGLGHEQIVLRDKFNLTNRWGIAKENAYSEDLVFNYNGAEQAGFTNTGKMFVGLHNPDTYNLSVLGTGRIRSTAAADTDGAILNLEGSNLSNQAIRMSYNPSGTSTVIWELQTNFNTGEVRNFIKAGGGYFHTWYSNGVKSMTLHNSGNFSIGTVANTYKLDVNGTGNFSNKLQLATTSTTIAPLNIGGFGTIPTSPTAGDVVFDASDSSIKVRSGSNWIPYYYGKEVVAGTNITIGRGAWNVPDTINASGGGVTDGDKGDITVTGATWTIDNQAVTYAKIQNVTDARLLGRSAGSAGSAQEITVSSDMSLAAGVLGVGSNVPLKNGTNTFTGTNTFSTNDVTFNNVSPLITGTTAALKYTDQNDGRSLSVLYNTRKFTFTAQQGDFSFRTPVIFDLSAPNDALSLHSTGTVRINTAGTGTDIASRKLYVNGSVGFNKDSLTTVTSITSENFALVDNTTGQVKKVTLANVAASVGLNSSNTWTPSYTYTTNTSATSSGNFRYQQIGDQIYIHGEIVFNPTSTGVAQLDISLPFANGITNSYDVSGTGVAFDKAAEPVEIFYNNSGGTIAFKTTVAATGTRTYKFTATMHYQAP